MPSFSLCWCRYYKPLASLSVEEKTFRYFRMPFTWGLAVRLELSVFVSVDSSRVNSCVAGAH